MKVIKTDTTAKVEADTITGLQRNTTTIRTKKVGISSNTRRRSPKTTIRKNKMTSKVQVVLEGVVIFKNKVKRPNYKSKPRTDLQQWKMISD